MQHVVILGAGPAGVAAASQLRRRNVADVTVIDRGERVGGLAGSFEVSGVRVDFGSHRLHHECTPAILADLRDLLGDDLVYRRRHGRIRLEGRWLSFPLRPLNLARNLPVRWAARTALDLSERTVQRPSGAGESFADVMLQGVGPTLCTSFYFPYARKVWGLDPSEISPIQAVRRVAARSSAGLVRKAIASLPVVGNRQAGGFYYPRGGYGQITERLAADAETRGGRFVLGASVEQLRTDGQPSVAVRVGDSVEFLECDRIFSTIPMGVVVERACPAAPDEVVEAARSLRSRAMVLAYLTLSTDRFSEYDTHYFPQSDIPFSRISEPKNFSGQQVAGTTVLCAEIPTEVGSTMWTASDDEVRGHVVEGLARAGLSVSVPVTETTVVRLPAAYPIYDKGFERHFDVVDRWLQGLDRLVTFGRQGLFAHNNLHHVLEMAYSAAECMGPDGAFDRARWSAHRTAFDRHVVVD